MTNTNKAVGFVLVNSKEIKSVVTNERTMFPVQVRMELQIGAKSQVVSFGHSALGGRQTYLSAQGKAPVIMSRADFIKKLRDAKIENINTVSKALSAIRYFNRDEFVVAKCECCGTGYVTAANVDFIQRNHKTLSEKLGREVTEFSRICYTCQGHDGNKPVKKQQAKKDKPATTPAQAHAATCVHCGKGITQNVLNWSLKHYGKALCHTPCQGKHPLISKDNKQQAPTQQTVKKEEPANTEVPVQQPIDKHEEANIIEPKTEDKLYNGLLLTPALVREIMALNVDKFSELGKLQDELEGSYQIYARRDNHVWGTLFKAQEPKAPEKTLEPEVKKVEVTASAASVLDKEASAASVNNGTSKANIPFADELCLICDQELPPVDQWKYEVCPTCCLPTGHLLDLPVDMAEAAHKYIESASGASASLKASETGVLAGKDSSEPSSQEEAKGSGAVSEKDTKEVPMNKASEETDTKSQNPAGPSNGSGDSGKIAEFLNAVAQEFQDSNVPPMPNGDVVPM